MIQLTISKKKKKIASRIEIFLIRQFEKSSILASSHNLRGWKFLLNFEIAIVCSSREEFKPSEIVATFQTRCWYDFVSSLLRGKKKKRNFAQTGFGQEPIFYTWTRKNASLFEALFQIEGIIFCSFDPFAFEIFIFPCDRVYNKANLSGVKSQERNARRV